MNHLNIASANSPTTHMYGDKKISITKQELFGILSKVKTSISGKDYRSNSYEEFKKMIEKERELYSHEQGNIRIIIVENIVSQLKRILKEIYNNRKQTTKVVDKEKKIELLETLTMFSYFQKCIEEIEKITAYNAKNKDNFDYKDVLKEYKIVPQHRLHADDVAKLPAEAVKIVEDFFGTSGLLSALPKSQEDACNEFMQLRMDSVEKALKDGDFFNDSHPSYKLLKSLYMLKNPEMPSDTSTVQGFISKNYTIDKCIYKGISLKIGDEITYTQSHMHNPVPLGSKCKIKGISLMIKQNREEKRADISYLLQLEGHEGYISIDYFIA